MRQNELAYLVSSYGIIFELFGNHESGVVVLEEPLLVKSGVEGGQGLADCVDVNLQRSSDLIETRAVHHHGPVQRLMEAEIHAL